MTLMLMPEAINLADIACRDEAVNVVGLQVVHQGGELRLRQQGLNLYGLPARITSRHIVEAASSHQVIDDVIPDTLMFFGDDADSLAEVEAGGEVVDHHSVDPCANKADDDHAERMDGKCRAADHGTGDGDGHSDIEMEVLVPQDIESLKDLIV